MSENATLDTVIATSVAAMLEDGRIQEIIDAKLEDAVADAVQAAIGYGGKTGKAIREMVDDAMCAALKSRVLPRYNVKLEAALDTVIAQSKIAETAKLLRNFEGIMDPKSDPRSTVTADSLFGEYCDYVAYAYDCHGREVDFDDEPSYAPIECRMGFDEAEPDGYSRSHRHGVLRFWVADIDETWNDAEKLCFDVPVYRWEGFDAEGEWHVQDTPPVTFGGLASMNGFEVRVSALAHAGCKVDVSEMPGEEHVEPEAKPEPDWS